MIDYDKLSNHLDELIKDTREIYDLTRSNYSLGSIRAFVLIKDWIENQIADDDTKCQHQSDGINSCLDPAIDKCKKCGEYY